MDDVNSIMLSKPLCVIVHYRAWTESTQHKFEDTWNEQRPVELIIGKGMCLYDPFFIFCTLYAHGVPFNKISFYLSKKKNVHNICM